MARIVDVSSSLFAAPAAEKDVVAMRFSPKFVLFWKRRKP
jgi:hypothetical protein